MTELKSISETAFDEEVIGADVPTLVDFWTPQCVPCKSVSAFLEKFSETAPGRVKIVKVNAEECPGLAARMGVRGVPTLILFHRGRAVGTKTGVLLPHELRRWIESCLTENPDPSA
jgi:thioredoxin